MTGETLSLSLEERRTGVALLLRACMLECDDPEFEAGCLDFVVWMLREMVRE